MQREFNCTMAVTYQDLYTLVLAVTGAIPTDGILPDRVNDLQVIADPANTGTITMADRNNANNAGLPFNNMTKRSTRNTICLRDYLFKGSSTAQKIIVTMESM